MEVSHCHVPAIAFSPLSMLGGIVQLLSKQWRTTFHKKGEHYMGPLDFSSCPFPQQYSEGRPDWPRYLSQPMPVPQPSWPGECSMAHFHGPCASWQRRFVVPLCWNKTSFSICCWLFLMPCSQVVKWFCGCNGYSSYSEAWILLEWLEHRYCVSTVFPVHAACACL